MQKQTGHREQQGKDVSSYLISTKTEVSVIIIITHRTFIPMPRITLKLGQPLSQILGQRRLNWELPQDSTAASLLQELEQRYPQFGPALRGQGLGRPSPYIFFLNGRPVTPSNYESIRLREGDVVHLVLPVVGGEHA